MRTTSEGAHVDCSVTAHNFDTLYNEVNIRLTRASAVLVWRPKRQD